MKRRGNRPTVITDAQRSQEDQLHTREIRYVAMMAIRLLCLIAAAIIVSLQPPLWWLWVALCATGMILLPWIAVVLANDRLPKERHRWRRHRPGPEFGRELPAGGGERRPARTIDPDQ